MFDLPTNLAYLYWLHHLCLIKHRVQFQVQKAAWKQSIPLFSSDPRNTFPFQLSFGIPFRAMGCTFEYPLEQWRHQFPLLSIQWVRFRIAIGFIPIVPTLFCLSDHFHFCQMLLLFISRNIHEVFRDSFSSSQPLPEGRASTAWSTWQATTTTLNNTTNKYHQINRQTTTLSPQGGLASFVRCLLHQRLFKTEGNRKPMVATVYLHSG